MMQTPAMFWSCCRACSGSRVLLSMRRQALRGQREFLRELSMTLDDFDSLRREVERVGAEIDRDALSRT